MDVQPIPVVIINNHDPTGPFGAKSVEEYVSILGLTFCCRRRRLRAEYQQPKT